MGDMTNGPSGSVGSVLKRCVWAFRGCELSFYAEVNYGIIKKSMNFVLSFLRKKV